MPNTQTKQNLNKQEQLELDAIRYLNHLRNLASNGHILAERGEIEKSYDELQEIKRYLPSITNLLQQEIIAEEAVQESERNENQQRQEAGKIEREEERVDFFETKILQDIKLRLGALHSYIGKTGIKQATKNNIIKQINHIQQEIKKIIKVERLENKELREDFGKELTNNYKNERILGLFRKENRLLPLLSNFIDDIEKEMKGNPKALEIIGILNRAIKITEELIQINLTEIRELKS